MHKFLYFYLFCVIAMCIRGETERRLSACGESLGDLVGFICENHFAQRGKKSDDVVAFNHRSPLQQQYALMERGLDVVTNPTECVQLKLVEQFNNENKRQRESSSMVPSAAGGYPFRNRFEAMDFGHFTRRRRQLSQECCLKSCTLSEIKVYCHE